MKKYQVSFSLLVDEKWVEDGLNAGVLARRIKDELPGNLCAYAYGSEIIVKNIIVKKS